MRRRTWIACSAAIVLGAPATPRPLVAQVAHACDLVSPADIATATKRSDLANARQIRSTSDQSQPGGPIETEGTECGFMGTSLTVELQRLASVERFDAAVAGRVRAGELVAHHGLGDAAWFRHNRSLSQHGFMVRAGNHLVMIMIDTSEAGSADDAKTQLLPLARAAIAKLR